MLCLAKLPQEYTGSHRPSIHAACKSMQWLPHASALLCPKTLDGLDLLCYLIGRSSSILTVLRHPVCTPPPSYPQPSRLWSHKAQYPSLLHEQHMHGRKA